jgi:hypothetical protein
MTFSGANAVVVAFDPAKRSSGAAIFLGPGVLHSAYTVKKQSEREYVVKTAVELARAADRPLVCIAETWDPPRHRRRRTVDGAERVEFDQKWTYKTVLGIGEGWGLWAAELERYEVKYIVRKTPNEWRDRLFGKRRGKRTDDAKAQAVLYARCILKSIKDNETDLAEAVCIGACAYNLPETFTFVEKWSKKCKRK